MPALEVHLRTLALEHERLLRAEDLDCSGIPVCSEQVCTYDEGFLAGVLHAFNGHEYRVKEVDCWGSGDRVCRFTVDPA